MQLLGKTAVLCAVTTFLFGCAEESVTPVQCEADVTYLKFEYGDGRESLSNYFEIRSARPSTGTFGYTLRYEENGALGELSEMGDFHVAPATSKEEVETISWVSSRNVMSVALVADSVECTDLNE